MRRRRAITMAVKGRRIGFLICFLTAFSAPIISAQLLEGLNARAFGELTSAGQGVKTFLADKSKKRLVHVSSYVSLTDSAFVSQGSMKVYLTTHGSTHPAASVSFYDPRGRYLGNGTVQGGIYVSGMMSGNWVNVSGSGQVEGDFAVEEAGE